MREGYKRVDKLSDESEKVKNLLKNKKLVAIRRRNNIRRLALANFTTYDKFITFTFKENIKDIDFANRMFKNFIKRLRYKIGDFKYISVIQFQERGAVHYHALMDIGYLEKEQLEKLWGHGYCKINAIDYVDNVGAYIVSYMVKNFDDDRLRGRKAYLLSKNLSRPRVIKGVAVDKILNDIGVGPVYESEYLTEKNGVCYYKEFNLRRCRK